MSNKFIALALVGTMAAAPAFAQDTSSSFDWTGSYVGISALSGRVSDGTTYDQKGFGAQYNYLKDNGQLVFGGEVSYQQQDISVPGGGSKAVTTALKAVVGFSTGKALIYANAGMANVDIQQAVPNKDTVPVMGLGVRYAVTDKISAGVEYSQLKKNGFGTQSNFTYESNSVALRVDYKF
jgi:outer membrane immunogenic protein